MLQISFAPALIIPALFFEVKIFDSVALGGQHFFDVFDRIVKFFQLFGVVFPNEFRHAFVLFAGGVKPANFRRAAPRHDQLRRELAEIFARETDFAQAVIWHRHLLELFGRQPAFFAVSLNAFSIPFCAVPNFTFSFKIASCPTPSIPIRPKDQTQALPTRTQRGPSMATFCRPKLPDTVERGRFPVLARTTNPKPGLSKYLR
jgi:hypothetical protein